MGRVVNIAWKDLRVTFRDPGALIMMLATPFVLTLVIAFAFGGSGGSGSTMLRDVPVVVVNLDKGTFGGVLVDTLRSPDLGGLLQPSQAGSPEAARSQVDQDKAVAAVIIPAGFSESIAPSGPGATPPQSVVEVYSNPTRQVSAGVVRSIVESVLNHFAAGSAAAQVSITQLLANGLIAPQDAYTTGQQIGVRAAEAAGQRLITISTTAGTSTTTNQQSSNFDWLAYMAPSMAILFLMFTVTSAGRTILAEREGGTLPRMLVTPTRAAQVIGGKVLGIFIVGLVQMAVLIGVSYGLFGVRWGSTAGVVLLTVALVAAATGWGALLAAYCRTPAQAGQLGAMLALVFAILAGNLMPRAAMPEWLKTISYITPNAWGLEGYTRLGGQGTLGDILFIVIALVVMAVVLLAGATVMFRRQYA